jgi:hypothetical protein
VAGKKRPRGVGRPSLGAAARKTVISIKATADEAATWQAAAEREGISFAEWLRAAAELAIARGSTR